MSNVVPLHRGRHDAWLSPRGRLLLVACLTLLAALLPAKSAFAVASSQPVTAILQGASQNGWITETQLRAEYTKWAAYPNVVPAFRSTSSNKDEAKMVGWESAGLKYFYTAISSDYRFAGSMYAAAGAPEAVLARTNNQGLYFHQLLTQLTADNGWAWQTGIGKVNWALVDQWVLKAQSLGKKVVWNEPSHAWDEVKKNATALAYFKKWGSTVAVTYGTNFPDQVDSWAKPGAASLASTAGNLRGASVQAFNFTDRSVAVTRAGVKSLVDAALTNGSTYLEFSGASADLQPGSQLLLGAQDALSAAPTQPAPKSVYPGTPAFTAILMGNSQKGWTSETQQRAEYAKWITYPNVRPAFRGMAFSKDDPIMAGWQRDGYKYYWTAASSDYRNEVGSMYESVADASTVLDRSNSLGLYFHEVVSQNAATNGWNWRQAVWDTDWGRLDQMVTKARAVGKKIIWSEPSHAWNAILNDAAARERIRSWGETLVVTYATNFPDQIDSFSKPAAQALASQFGQQLGASIQSWHWFDQMPAATRNSWNLAPSGPTTPAATAAATVGLSNAGVAAGATYFQFEGTAPDMQPSSPYSTGIRQFLDALKSTSSRPIPGSAAQRVPIYASLNIGTNINDQALTRTQNELAANGYYDQGLVGYVLDRPAPGTAPLHAMYSDSASDYFYTADQEEVDWATGAKPGWEIRYRDLGIIGYVYTEVYADTVPLYQLWNNSADTNDHAYTTSPWIKGKYNSVGYGDQRVAGYLFDNDGRNTTYPLTQMWNSSTANHFYTASADEVTQYGAMGYENQKDVGMINTEPVAGAVPLYEAYSAEATDHLYTTDPFEIRLNVRGWLKYANVRVVGYMSPTATSTATRGVMKLWTNGEPGKTWMSDHMLTADMDERVYNEQSFRHYVYQETIGYLAPVSYPSSVRFGGADGSVNEEGEALAYLDAREAAPSAEADLSLENGLKAKDRKWVDDYEYSLPWVFEDAGTETSTPMPADAAARAALGSTTPDNYAQRMAAGESPDTYCDNKSNFQKLQKRKSYLGVQHTYTYSYKSQMRIYACYDKTNKLVEIFDWRSGKWNYKFHAPLTNHYRGKGYLVRWADAGWRTQNYEPSVTDHKKVRLEQDFEIESCSDKSLGIIATIHRSITAGEIVQVNGGFDLGVNYTNAWKSCKLHLGGTQVYTETWEGKVEGAAHRTDQ